MKKTMSFRQFYKHWHSAQPYKDMNDMVRRAVKDYSDNIAVEEKVDGKVVKHTYSEWGSDINSIGTALRELGLNEAHIALVGPNSYNWIAAHLAVFCGQGVVVPIDKELPDDDIIRLMEKADATAVICGRDYVAGVKKYMAANPSVTHMFVLEGGCTDGNTGLDDLIKRGRELIAAGDDSYGKYSQEDTERVSEIIFTSGTTGANKGVMLSHKNLCQAILNIDEMMSEKKISYDVVKPGSRMFSLLPMNHAYELNCSVLPALNFGITVCINDNLRNIMPNLNMYKPDFSLVVPLFCETIYKTIKAQAKELGMEKKLDIAIKISDTFRPLGIDLREVFFKQLKTAFGGKFRLLIVGGAPCNPAIIKWLDSVGFNILFGYGISECSPLVSLNRDTFTDPESVGMIMPHTDVYIKEPDDEGSGEIMVRGNIVSSGYYKDEESTRTSFSEDGWFGTGDFGKLEPGKGLKITGRKKSLIILDNGKNVHPEEIEQIIQNQIPYVREVIVHDDVSVIRGSSRRAIAAAMYIEEMKIDDPEHQEKIKQIVEEMRRINGTLPSYKQVRYVYLTHSEFKRNGSKKILRNAVDESKKDSEKVSI